MSKRKVLITDVCDPSLEEGLLWLGYAVDYRPAVTQSEVEGTIEQYTGIVITTKTILNQTVLDGAVNLRFIARAGSGMENVDVAFAESKNIRCINSPEGNRNSVAEHATGLLLSLFHHIPRSFSEIQKGEWNIEGNRVTELSGKTIGIIGYGNTGSAFARKLSVFDVQVLAYDKYKSGFSDDYAKEVTLEEIFTSADVLSLHVPLSNETKHLVNEEFISRFNKNFILLNTSRGGVVNTKDLIRALQQGKITGAGLDVLENENFGNYSEEEKESLSKLLDSGEVIITPHIAGKSFQSRKNFAEVLLKKIAALY